LIFTAFRQYCWTRLGEHSEDISRGLPNFVMTESYPDEAFAEFVARAVDASGRSRRDILVDFGRYTGFFVFRVMRGDYYAESGSMRQFLLDVESRIHETVRESTPLAAPPRLHVVPLGDDGVSIAYTSERKLCELLEGLVLGVAEYYGEAVSIEQPICMHRGDLACSVLVTRTVADATAVEPS
jgi:hypothetical protein